MRTELGDKIHAVLRKHVGENNAITSAEIADELGFPASAQRQIREVVATESSLWGDDVVCGFGGLGYFICADLEEAIKYRDWLLGTFTEIGEKIEAFERHCAAHGLCVPPPLDELFGEKIATLRAWLDRYPAKLRRKAA